MLTYNTKRVDINLLSLFVFLVPMLFVSYKRLTMQKIIHKQAVFYEQMMSQDLELSGASSECSSNGLGTSSSQQTVIKVNLLQLLQARQCLKWQTHSLITRHQSVFVPLQETFKTFRA